MRLEHVSKVYQTETVQVQALCDISITIADGEFLAIVGPSGSGKTTLLDIIGCLSRPAAGHYFFQDTDTGRLSDAELARLRNQKLGFVFQTFHLLPKFNVLENVELPLVYAGVQKTERHRRAGELLERLGLSERLYHRPNQLSGGQAQRAAIARALVNRPTLILADEPTGNLDSASGAEVLGLLRQLNQEGHTLVLITHDRDVAAQASRVVALRDGNVLI